MKYLKNFLIVLLAFILMIIPGLSASAQAVNYTADCPYIFVHGFMASTIYVNPDDPNSEAAWPPSSDKILAAVKSALPYIGKLLINHNWNEFGNKVVPIVKELFEPIMLGSDGNVKDKSGVRWSYPAAETISKTSQLEFVYDWRLSPIETAASLDDFIDYVLECSGTNQIVLECHSYGGVVANTYAKLYGTSKVRSWLFNSTAIYGETYTGDLMTGNMHFDADALTAYLKGVFDYNQYEELFNALISVLNKTGVTDSLMDLTNLMVEKIGDQVVRECIAPMFGGWLSIWAMIPDEKINEAYSYVFDTVYKNTSTDWSGLKEKITEYNTKVRPYKTDTLKQIDNTSNLYVVSRYGYSGMFLTPSWQTATDMIIDVKYSSFGATSANYNCKLSDDYVKNVDSKYISPDKSVDASSCLFPEQTWFIRRFTHAESCDNFETFKKTLLYYNGQATVDTFEEYPRFMYYDEDTNEIKTNTLSDKNETLIDKIKQIINFNKVITI